MSEYLDKNVLAKLGPLDSDDIALRQALAMFISDYINEGGKTITNLINYESRKYQKYERNLFFISLAFIILAAVSFLISIASSRIDPVLSHGSTILTLILLFFAFIPRFWMQSLQYGKEPDAPLDLPHPAHERIDLFFAPLQKEFELKAYYYSVFKKKRIPLEHKQFFGKLRYLLFSEHRHIRSLVLRYPTAIASPQDIFIRRSDLEKMIEDSKPKPEPEPKRKGGTGRTPSSRYADALIALLGDQNLLQIDTCDTEAANREIKETLKAWFKANKDESEWEPKSNQIATYVEKIYDHLKNIAASR